MATFNATSSTNNANQVLWTYSTKLVWHTDRDVTGTSRAGEVQAVENLGVTVATGDPFTLLT
jgi:hypothetical protein